MKNKIVYCEIFSTWPEDSITLEEYKNNDPNKDDHSPFQTHTAHFKNKIITEPFFIMTKIKNEDDYIIHDTMNDLYQYLKSLNDRVTLIFGNEMVGRATVLKQWILNELNFYFVKFRDYDYGHQQYIMGNSESFIVKDNNFMMNVIDFRDKGHDFYSLKENKLHIFLTDYLLQNIQTSNKYPTEQEIDQVKHHLNIIEEFLGYYAPTNFSKNPFKYLNDNSFEPLRKPKRVKMKSTEVLDHWEGNQPIIRKETEEEREQRLYKNKLKKEQQKNKENINKHKLIHQKLRELSFLDQMKYLKQYEDILDKKHNEGNEKYDELFNYFKEKYINNLNNIESYKLGNTNTGQVPVKIKEFIR